MILDHFEWNIFIPSPTHYVDILRNNILLSDDIYGGNQLPEAKSRQFTEILDGLTDFVHYFLDISMQVCTVISKNRPKLFRIFIDLCHLCYVFSFFSPFLETLIKCWAHEYIKAISRESDVRKAVLQDTAQFLVP